MDEKEKKKLENLNRRYARQNKANKERYYSATALLPLKTDERIKALGLSVNGAINASLLPYLDRLEQSAGIAQETRQKLQEATETPESDKIPTDALQAAKITPETQEAP